MLSKNLKLIIENPIGMIISSIQFFKPRKISLGNCISIFIKSIEDLSKIKQTERAKRLVKMDTIFFNFGESKRVRTSMFICLFSRVAIDAPMKASHRTVYLNIGSAHDIPVSNMFLNTTCVKLMMTIKERRTIKIINSIFAMISSIEFRNFIIWMFLGLLFDTLQVLFRFC